MTRRPSTPHRLKSLLDTTLPSVGLAPMRQVPAGTACKPRHSSTVSDSLVNRTTQCTTRLQGMPALVRSPGTNTHALRLHRDSGLAVARATRPAQVYKTWVAFLGARTQNCCVACRPLNLATSSVRLATWPTVV
jgi:hypothetical protein